MANLHVGCLSRGMSWEEDFLRGSDAYSCKSKTADMGAYIGGKRKLPPSDRFSEKNYSIYIYTFK